MKLEQLIENNYTILNGKIESLSLKLVNDNELVFILNIIGDGWRCSYGGFNIRDSRFTGIELLYSLMKTLGVEDLYNINGLNVRVAVQDNNTPVTVIGNIMYDEWFNYIDYYNEHEAEDRNPEFEFIDETKEDMKEDMKEKELDEIFDE